MQVQSRPCRRKLHSIICTGHLSLLGRRYPNRPWWNITNDQSTVDDTTGITWSPPPNFQNPTATDHWKPRRQVEQHVGHWWQVHLKTDFTSCTNSFSSRHTFHSSRMCSADFLMNSSVSVKNYIKFHPWNNLAQRWISPSASSAGVYQLFVVVNCHLPIYPVWRIVWCWLIFITLSY